MMNQFGILANKKLNKITKQKDTLIYKKEQNQMTILEINRRALTPQTQSTNKKEANRIIAIKSDNSKKNRQSQNLTRRK